MKGKKVFLISSILAAIGLVGGTFAAWAVTDNADPFSVKITPGTIDIEGDKSVTLDWGTKGLVDIENLQVNEEKGPYEVGLKATTSDASSFKGNLSVTLNTEENGATKLIDYLTVKVYDDAAKTNAALITVPEGAGDYSANADITVTSGTEKKVYFFVTLSVKASEVYETIKDQIVTMTVDWNKAADTPVVTAKTFYFTKPAQGWADAYAYAWRASDNKAALAWPGIKMTQEQGNIYSVAIPNYCDMIIFNDGNGNQTDDLQLPTNSYVWYNNNAWEAAPTITQIDYYLVGTFNEWKPASGNMLTKASGTAHEGAFTYTHKIEDVELPAGAELKIVSSDNVWYAEASTDGAAANMVIGQAGHYDFFFNTTLSDGVYIFCQQHQNA